MEFFQPEVQKWLKVVSTNDNNPLHNYICLSATAYRRKPRHEGLPILTSVIQKLVQLGKNICLFNVHILFVESMIHVNISFFGSEGLGYWICGYM